MQVLRRIPIRPDNPYRLGRHVEHDPRSRRFAFAQERPVGADATVYWPTCKTILNQGDTGGCVGWTGADWLNTDGAKRLRIRYHGGRKLLSNADGKLLYHLATLSDEFPDQYPPIDDGSSGLGLAKALKKLGVIDRYTHCFSFDQFRAAIAFQPVSVGTLWTESMFEPDADGIVTVGDMQGDNVVGGHQYVGRGLDYERRLVWCRNHWTRRWGLRGEFGIRFDEFEALLDAQGDVTVMHGVGLPAVQ